MPAGFEREIKLQFSAPAAAREALRAAGATPTRERRLQRDALLDTSDGYLRDRRSALRVRIEPEAVTLTFKGPVQPGVMKMREEIETRVAEADALLLLLDRLGYAVWFRYEKYREEFTLHACVVAVDETPVGTFVEIEGDEPAVAAAASALGRSRADYIIDSYRGLQARRCETLGLPLSDMLFARTENGREHVPEAGGTART